MDNLDVTNDALAGLTEGEKTHGKKPIEIDVTRSDGTKVHITVPNDVANGNAKVKTGLDDLVAQVNGTHREDGDDKPKGPFDEGRGGPFGSPGDDEPKPGDDGYALAAANDGNKGSVSVNIKKAADYAEPKQPGGYEAAANSDAANNNIVAAEAELKGRVNEAKERHVG